LQAVDLFVTKSRYHTQSVQSVVFGDYRLELTAGTTALTPDQNCLHICWNFAKLLPGSLSFYFVCRMKIA